jgi:hypothetical protein
MGHELIFIMWGGGGGGGKTGGKFNVGWGGKKGPILKPLGWEWVFGHRQLDCTLNEHLQFGDGVQMSC